MENILSSFLAVFGIIFSYYLYKKSLNTKRLLISYRYHPITVANNSRIKLIFNDKYEIDNLSIATIVVSNNGHKEIIKEDFSSSSFYLVTSEQIKIHEVEVISSKSDIDVHISQEDTHSLKFSFKYLNPNDFFLIKFYYETPYLISGVNIDSLGEGNLIIHSSSPKIYTDTSIIGGVVDIFEDKYFEMNKNIFLHFILLFLGLVFLISSIYLIFDIYINKQSAYDQTQMFFSFSVLPMSFLMALYFSFKEYLILKRILSLPKVVRKVLKNN